MEKILVLSSYTKSNKILTDIVNESGNYEVLNATNELECKNIIAQNDIDLAIINAPLIDGQVNKLIIFISEKSDCSVIYIVKDMEEKEIIKLKNKGIYVIKKPLSKVMLKGIINCYIINRNKYRLIMEENKKLQQRINNIKVIDRAKLTLIQYLKMTEMEAHRYIEKQAMDLRITKVEVAKNILKIYEY